MKPSIFNPRVCGLFEVLLVVSLNSFLMGVIKLSFLKSSMLTLALLFTLGLMMKLSRKKSNRVE